MYVNVPYNEISCKRRPFLGKVSSSLTLVWAVQTSWIIAAPQQMLAKYCQPGSTTSLWYCLTSWSWRYPPCTFCVITLSVPGAPFLFRLCGRWTIAVRVERLIRMWVPKHWQSRCASLIIPSLIYDGIGYFIVLSGKYALRMTSTILTFFSQRRTYWISSFITQPMSRLRYVC